MGHKLKWMRYIFNWIYSINEPKVNWNKIDKSGIVMSDYPVENNGWIKGWVSGIKSAIVCTHANPVIGNKIHININGKKVVRTIVDIDNTYAKYDISICRLDIPWPTNVKIYQICKNVKKNQLVCVFHQDMTISLRRLLINDENKTIFGNYYTREIIAGDSGLPWFVWEDDQFKICTHSHQGIWGIGPNYSTILNNKL
jgi:hypothetical protein